MGLLPAHNFEALFPPFAVCFDKPSRNKAIYGGRGSAKSHFFAGKAVLRAVAQDTRFLCTRELQTSIDESVKKLIENKIDDYKLHNFFEAQKTKIIGPGGSEFLFEGLHHNVDKIKSLEGIDISWQEEAQRISRRSLDILRPTIRKPGSELWFSFNPDDERAPVYQDFVVNTPPPSSIVVKANYDANPFFPDVLQREMEYMRSVDMDAFTHIWLGFTKKVSAAQILKGKYEIGSFTDEDMKGADGPYYGLDWGFSTDPLAGVRCWIKDFVLYIDYEFYEVGVENDDIKPRLEAAIPGIMTHTARADNARPETIAHVNKYGMSVVPCEKGPGSVEDGISFLRSFKKIVIHQRCKNMADEARLYSFKVDRLSGDVTTEIIDKHNHLIDALRYALEPISKQSGDGMGYFQLLAQEAAKLKEDQAKAQAQQT